MVEIENAALLADLFGHWPDFHDAELRALRLDTTDPAGVVLEADVEVAEMSHEVDARGYYGDRQRCRATLRFGGVLNARVDGFRRQNVLDALALEELGPAERAAAGEGWGARRYRVRLVPIGGFCAVEFLCDTVAVAHAAPVARTT